MTKAQSLNVGSERGESRVENSTGGWVQGTKPEGDPYGRMVDREGLPGNEGMRLLKGFGKKHFFEGEGGPPGQKTHSGVLWEKGLYVWLAPEKPWDKKAL